MKLNRHLLFLILSLNGIDAGITVTMSIIAGPRIEANPIMRFLLDIGPFAFLAVKVGMGQLLVRLIDNKGRLVPVFAMFLLAIYLVVDVRSVLMLQGIR